MKTRWFLKGGETAEQRFRGFLMASWALISRGGLSYGYKIEWKLNVGLRICWWKHLPTNHVNRHFALLVAHEGWLSLSDQMISILRFFAFSHARNKPKKDLKQRPLGQWTSGSNEVIWNWQARRSTSSILFPQMSRSHYTCNSYIVHIYSTAIRFSAIPNKNNCWSNAVAPQSTRTADMGQIYAPILKLHSKKFQILPVNKHWLYCAAYHQSSRRTETRFTDNQQPLYQPRFRLISA